MSETVLITGTSTGLGISLAVGAAKCGHKVYASMRDLAKREQLDDAARDAGVALNIVQLDVTDTKSVNRCVGEIVSTDGGISALINNAGAGFIRTTEQATEEEVAGVLDVNFLGVVRCTKAVLPHMRKARSGRIINISSIGGLVGQPFNEIYCAAKFAVEGYTEAMASYVGPAFGIHFTVVEPGGITTAFAPNIFANLEKTGGMLDDEYRPLLNLYLGAGRSNSADEGYVYQAADEVSRVVIKCLQSDAPPIRTRSSDWSEAFCSLKTDADPDGKKLQARVIDVSLGGIDALRNAVSHD